RVTARSSGSLGKRDWEALRLLAAGLTNKQIAAELGLSRNSVDKMLSNADDPRAIYPKIGVSNAKGAVTWYLQNRASMGSDAPAVPGAALPAEATPAAATPAATQPDPAPPVPAPPPHSPAPPPPDRRLHHGALTAFSAVCISVVVFLFIPFLAESEQSSLDSAFLNIYLVVPLLAGLYTLAASPTPRRDQRFLWGFRLFALGLISWSIGAIIYAVYDLLRGMQPHYPSLADLGFFSQTVLQAACFALLWRETQRRGGYGSVPWLAIALPVYLVYAAVVLSIRHLWQEAPIEQTIVLDGLSSFLDCASLAFAILLVLPRSMRLLDAPMRAVMRLMSAGMVTMFLAGFIYFTTLAVPESHWLFYGFGGWVDLLFLAAFVLFGLGLIDSTLCERAFIEDAAAPAAGTLEPAVASRATAS
ncbi:MAG: LuxR C-terminal-related transcriptional regulator, partial [Caldilineaceae bacterium]